MKPISFTCADTLPLTPAEVAGRILELSRWPDFTGYGPLPGVRCAVFETRTPGVVGTCIRVTNCDGSSHREEVVGWEADRVLRFAATDFSPPLSRLSHRFVETWKFEPVGSGTQVTRSFELHPKIPLTWPGLWLISYFLRRAVARHLQRMRECEQIGREEAPK
jgi:hypothetical protein